MTINLIVLPVIITIVLLCVMFRPNNKSGDYDFTGIFRILWLIPISIVWTIYFAILVLFK